MKKLLLLSVLIVSSLVYGQEKFEFTKEKGLSEYVITRLPTASSPVLIGALAFLMSILTEA